ncbi:Putative ankyrin repeat-containing domain superfamily [Septoria linicola]|uniref:Ankyrin repeat-containing domain superfamily n=1 Tax=Septoria linicola TaxID=215465 RepID=A0A9Q9AKF6_9PEZI|nr:putative ankyrin repeat-containing domain superfamily [Septoria linicola]USW50959.1 Putative ankyrin repeat-containing domain superfamily [Septoria linicola]
MQSIFPRDPRWWKKMLTQSVNLSSQKSTFAISPSPEIDSIVIPLSDPVIVSTPLEEESTLYDGPDRRALLQGHGINDMDGQQRTPLFYATDRALLAALVQHGASLEHRDALGRTPLMWYAKEGQHEMVDTLLDLGALADQVNTQHRRTALFYVSKAACVIALAGRGAANLAARDVHQLTPLMCHVAAVATRSQLPLWLVVQPLTMFTPRQTAPHFTTQEMQRAQDCSSSMAALLIIEI